MADAEFTITHKVRTKNVLKTYAKFEQRTLMRAGAFIWRSAKSSIRPKKTPSKPGKPPRSVTGRLRYGIAFNLTGNGHSVVVGPSFNPGRQGPGIPRLLETGGTRRRRVRPAPVADVAKKVKAKAKRPRSARELAAIRRETAATRPPSIFASVRIEPRPYMAPAFEKGMADLRRKFPSEVPATWQRSITT